MSLEQQVLREVRDRLDRVRPPAGDLGAVVARGRAVRRRRTTGVAVAALVCGGVVATGLGSGLGSGLTAPGPQELAPVGQLELEDGLRAFMSPDPDGEIWLGGRSFPARDVGYVDTDATATPYGMVFFDHAQQAHLLREDGKAVALAAAPDGSARGFHPSSKVDARLPLVAWTEAGDGQVTVRLYDLRAGETVDSLEVPCDGDEACAGVKVDALDQGLVFVRTAAGTSVWDPAAEGEGRWTRLTGPDSRVADARGRRILYTGPAPRPAEGSPIDRSWSFTAGQIDAGLSFDGAHLLYWSTTLEPVAPGARAIRLDAPVGDLPWVTFDTDGSVLVAGGDPEDDLRSVVYDCVLPSGSCERVGDISTASGDPIFVGNDM